MLDIVDMDLGLAAHLLHTRSRYDPKRILDVEFAPFCRIIIGSDERERQQFEAEPGHGLAGIAINRTKQLRQLVRLIAARCRFTWGTSSSRRSAAGL